jgi:tetratricopeptide (TPR) repeat protein
VLFAQQIRQAESLANSDPYKSVEVLNDLERAVQTDDYKARVRKARAWAYELVGNQEQKAGRYQEAESAYRKAVDDDPNNPAPHTDLGVLYEAQGDAAQTESDRRDHWADSADEWEAASKLATDARRADLASGYSNAASRLLLKIGVSLEREGNNAGALRFYGKAYETAAPGSPQQQQANQFYNELEKKLSPSR